jgi:CspA family cold shock protein
MQGTVRWFDKTKGYGFIRADEDGQDVFVYFTAIQMKGYKELTEGQKVEFERTRTPKGWAATKAVLATLDGGSTSTVQPAVESPSWGSRSR